MTALQEARVLVGESERIAGDLVLRPEMAFDVRRPQIVRHVSERRASLESRDAAAAVAVSPMSPVCTLDDAITAITLPALITRLQSGATDT